MKYFYSINIGSLKNMFLTVSELCLVSEDKLFDIQKILHYVEQLKNKDMSIFLDKIVR